MHLRNQKDFSDKLKEYELQNYKVQGNFIRHNQFSSDHSSNTRVLIKNEKFIEKDFKNISFNFLHFKNCEFLNCEIDDVNFLGIIYENSKFTYCTFSNTGFYESDIISCKFNFCRASYVLFSDTSLSNIEFNDCNELLELYFGGTYIENVSFNDSEIMHSRFEKNLTGDEITNYTFKGSKISHCYFDNNDLKKSNYENCILDKSVFVNCIFSKSTFSTNNRSENKEFASIDLHTINLSPLINAITLENVFGIIEPDIKSFISGLSTDIKLQTVFISYSFKDKVFASMLNAELNARGIITFLWEKDAPGGRPIKRIMIDNVRKFDKLLFIASENSIKSKACQFELSEGRKKQDINWETVFVPIHIDEFLFKVERDDIKPKAMQEEYWNNINELKDINSIDFSEFNKPDYDKSNFENSVLKLVNALRENQK